MRKKLSLHGLSRGLDFVPVLGPILMLISYLKGKDIVSDTPIQRTSRKGLAFVVSAVCTVITHLLLFLLGAQWIFHDINITPHQAKQLSLIALITGIIAYGCYSFFLGTHVLEGIQHFLAVRKRQAQIMARTMAQKVKFKRKHSRKNISGTDTGNSALHQESPRTLKRKQEDPK